MPAKPAALFAFVLLAAPLAAQPDPKKPDDKALVTKVYNIKPLIGAHGKANQTPDADAVIKLILSTIALGESKGAAGPQIVERDNGKLEVRANAKAQGEIADLLDALARLQDLTIDIKADVLELDAASYEKLLKALPKASAGKLPVVLATGAELEGDGAPDIDKALGEANKLLKAARLVQTSSARFVNGAKATVSARRAVVPYSNMGEPAGVARDNPLYVKEGFALVAVPVVSADRRFVRFKLTEQSTAVTGMKKRELGEFGGMKVIAQTPVVEDLGATGSAEVADGGTLLFKLAYAPKDKVWVVLLKPTIFIQAEEDALKKEGKQVKP
ncbi:MAG: hypothetical protein FJ304_12270 [Planctomycetes bacterium]|nr:hypothetical protein [Planctomycetota bacterium]